MAYSVTPTDLFKREAKRLSKKYRSLVSELQALSAALTENPHLGREHGAAWGTTINIENEDFEVADKDRNKKEEAETRNVRIRELLV